MTANDEFTRFELAEDLTGHHHHLLCLSCGKVIDITLPASLEHDIAAAIGQLADAESFQAHSHRLDVLGLCAELQVTRRRARRRCREAPACPARPSRTG